MDQQRFSPIPSYLVEEKGLLVLAGQNKADFQKDDGLMGTGASWWEGGENSRVAHIVAKTPVQRKIPRRVIV